MQNCNNQYRGKKVNRAKSFFYCHSLVLYPVQYTELLCILQIIKKQKNDKYSVPIQRENAKKNNGMWN